MWSLDCVVLERRVTEGRAEVDGIGIAGAPGGAGGAGGAVGAGNSSSDIIVSCCLFMELISPSGMFRVDALIGATTLGKVVEGPELPDGLGLVDGAGGAGGSCGGSGGLLYGSAGGGSSGGFG